MFFRSGFINEPKGALANYLDAVVPFDAVKVFSADAKLLIGMRHDIAAFVFTAGADEAAAAPIRNHACDITRSVRSGRSDHSFSFCFPSYRPSSSTATGSSP